MSLPRPALLGILGLALIMATLLATRGFTGGSDVITTPLPETSVDRPGGGDRQRPRAGERATVPADLPRPVARALEQRKLVVVLFVQRGAADDAATRAAVRAVERNPRVEAFADRVENLSRYRSIVAELPISQTPAVVILRGDGKARLLEGFTDAGSLRQHVTDALR